MAVIQKIRNKYGKIAGAVIAIALVGFIFMDAASGRFGDLFGSDKSVAKVDGEKIDQKDFSLRVKEYETLYGIFGKSKTIDDNARAELSSQAMQNMVFEKVVENSAANWAYRHHLKKKRKLSMVRTPTLWYSNILCSPILKQAVSIRSV